MKLKQEWKLFKQDFKRQAEQSLMFRINWYVLKPTALVLVIIALIILQEDLKMGNRAVITIKEDNRPQEDWRSL